jgi:hypothetical protein
MWIVLILVTFKSDAISGYRKPKVFKGMLYVRLCLCLRCVLFISTIIELIVHNFKSFFYILLWDVLYMTNSNTVIELIVHVFKSFFAYHYLLYCT